MSKGVFVTNEQVRLTGSPNVARFLAQCLYWSTKSDLVIQRQGWFYKSRTEWQAETWLSRYQQEKARQQLRNMGLLKERRERTNLGIRIWFWLDQALLNMLVNNLADQPIETGTENNSVELYDSSLTGESGNSISGQLDSCKEADGSKSVTEYKTIVLKTPLKNSFNGVNGTMVLNNFNKDCINDSDYFCNEVEVIEEAESGKQEAAASSLPELTNQSDNVDSSQSRFEREDDLIPFFSDEDINHALENIDPQSGIQHCEDEECYKACHPFIYQFVKTRILTGLEWSENALTLFRANGLRCEILQDALRVFICKYGHSIIAWYQVNTPIRVKPLAKSDIELAVLISEGALS
ncbi:hypothetical protein NX722_05750 [Endozoicomonas gorgoniicola]|uniref:Uncharacterized protein n=1 Tax=Endozoicomonas gorgoniicola TaxID=1234144 RepID=A0ABT3MRZ9_9GAMM|nr:hypothetical protein [Endozoicomonas gorgoniicola]MCW7552157.1 hypothetical protein [Endozoicomonas gorgoniicola]